MPASALVIGWHFPFLHAQIDYIKDEQRHLKREMLRAQEVRTLESKMPTTIQSLSPASQEVKRIQSVPLVIGQFLEAVDEGTGIVGSTTGNSYYVRILSTINREKLKPNSSVALHRHSNALVEVCFCTLDSSDICACDRRCHGFRGACL